MTVQSHSDMQVSTLWQTAYYTPAPAVFTARKPPRKTRCDIGTTKRIVLAYLEKHGITERRDMLKNLGMSHPKLRHALEKLGSLVEYEQSGAADGRMCHYWAVSNPPRVDQRCASYQALDFIAKNPWSYAADIPEEIIATPRNRHMCVLNLEVSGRLISRVHNGRKQYKVAL